MATTILFTIEKAQRAREQIVYYCARVTSHSEYLGKVSPELTHDNWAALVEIGGFYFESGLHDFDNWCSQVIRVTGEPIRPFLLKVFYGLPSAAKTRAQQLHSVRRSSSVTQSDVLNALSAFESLSPPTSSAPPTVISEPPAQALPNTIDRRNSSSSAPVTPSRVPAKNTHRKENALEQLLAELHSHVGLASVKNNIEQLANSISVDDARRAKGFRVADRSLHMIFYGNPGTGKTTVARLVAQIYKELGVLAKGHLICTDRAGLVANYVGQTATKVMAVVQKAIGGVLFIDEVYSLAPPDSRNDFGQEAIQQLLLLMENHRNELVVIVAGYPEEMVRFLDANPGLSSRFTKKMHFEDYSPEELMQIFEKMCRENDYRLHGKAIGKLLRSVQAAYNQRNKTFGNARFARNLFEEATRNLANRVVGSDLSNSSTLTVIMEDDIPDHCRSIGSSNPSRQFPDLGRYLAGKGIPQKTALIYKFWEIDNLAIVGLGHYCATHIQPMDGNLYCATFDFGSDILEQILARAPAATRTLVTRSLEDDPDSIRHLPLPNPINLGIAATLGNLQQSLQETFIPLVITTVFGSDLTATMQEMRIDPSGSSLSEGDGIKHSANSEQISQLPLLNPEITMADVKAIRVYCRHLAKEWWKVGPRQVAICDACNSPILRDEGFLMDSYLRCETCFSPTNTPDAALDNLSDDADYYGEGLLDEARRFAGMRPRK